MRNALKAVGFCLAAQALFVLRTRLGVAFFGNESVLAVTSVAAAAGGLLVAATRFDQVRPHLGFKTLALAALAAGLGVALHAALELAGREAAGAAAAALMAYAAPLFATLLMLALKWEAPDTMRVAGVASGLLCVGWLIAGPETAATLVAEPRGLLLLSGAGLALAGFLAVAQKLVAAASVEFAAAAVLLGGGLLTAFLAGGQAFSAAGDLLAHNLTTALATLAFAGGTALAYGLLFAGLQQLKVSTVGASFLTAAPWSALYLALVQGAVLDTTAQAGAIGALAAFGIVVSRDKQA